MNYPDKIHAYCVFIWGVPGSYLSSPSPPQSDSYHHSHSPAKSNTCIIEYSHAGRAFQIMLASCIGRVHS